MNKKQTPQSLKPATAAADHSGLLPDDVNDRALIQAVHPTDWQNPTPEGRYNLVVIGAGTAGLVCAAGAAGLGAKVALIEKGLMGGDCLNFGCVPSKALLRSSRAAADARTAAELGVGVGDVSIDFGKVMSRMRKLRAQIANHDGAQSAKDKGIDVYLGAARFVDDKTIQVGDARLSFARAVIATGTRAATLPIPGLNEVGPLTNETIFSLTELPQRLVVIGAGAIGCELGQAFARLGSRVTIVERAERIMPNEDADAARVVAEQLVADGVGLRLGATISRVERTGEQTTVHLASGKTVVADQLLVAAGRVPNTEHLGLDAANVSFDRHGVHVDARLRTRNKRVYAAGDVCSRLQFTHTADAMARIVLQNAFFFGRKKTRDLVVPWCTYTDPEVAHVGLSAAELGERNDIATLTTPLLQNDRAIVDGETSGFARVHVLSKTGRIVAATLVGKHAGESIGIMVLAIKNHIPLSELASVIHPYPTQAAAFKTLGDNYNRERLTPGVKTWFSRWFRWLR